MPCVLSFSCSCSLKEKDSQMVSFQEEIRQCKEQYNTKVSETAVIIQLKCIICLFKGVLLCFFIFSTFFSVMFLFGPKRVILYISKLCFSTP